MSVYKAQKLKKTCQRHGQVHRNNYPNSYYDGGICTCAYNTYIPGMHTEGGDHDISHLDILLLHNSNY